jgi:uncharacterized protein YjbJ (UPF0337 family)
MPCIASLTLPRPGSGNTRYNVSRCDGRLPEIAYQETDMGINKDQVEGRAKEVGGKIEEEFGKVTGNKTEQLKGKIRKDLGAGQANLGDVTEKVKEANRKL